MPPAATLLVYTYKNCGACRKATKWLAAQGLAFQERPIRDTPPTVTELRTLLAHLGGERRRLCNTSGADYRAEKLGEIVDALPEADFLARLAANGNLVKRPFLLRAATPGPAAAPALGLVGFKEAEWANALGA